MCAEVHYSSVMSIKVELLFELCFSEGSHNMSLSFFHILGGYFS